VPLVKISITDPVTAAAAPTAIFVLLDSAVLAAVMIALSLEVICMTSRTVRRVTVERISDVFIVVLMAGTTTDATIVVTRIITDGRMCEVDGRPTLREVARATLSDRYEMIVQPLWLTADGDGAIVTGAAAIGDALMIESTSRKGRSSVTV
jgi:hypothetical protein